jgi:hypothetical protein
MSVPSVKAILDYWYTKERLHEAKYFIDLGEPTCWACGQGWNGRYDVVGATFAQCVKAWERAPLQRCHIVPRTLGGATEPSNFVLMCLECHDRAPNTTSREVFFAWFKKQSWIKRESARLSEALEDAGFDFKNEAEMKRITETLYSAEFREWSKARSSLHWGQSERQGAVLTHSTVVGLLREYLENVRSR